MIIAKKVKTIIMVIVGVSFREIKWIWE